MLALIATQIRVELLVALFLLLLKLSYLAFNIILEGFVLLRPFRFDLADALEPLASQQLSDRLGALWTKELDEFDMVSVVRLHHTFFA